MNLSTLTREDILNKRIPMKELLDGWNVPELDLEYGHSKNNTDLATRVIDACLNFYRNEKQDICTTRMKSYMEWASENLSSLNGPQDQKSQDAKTVLFHMYFCRQVDSAGIGESMARRVR